MQSSMDGIGIPVGTSNPASENVIASGLLAPGARYWHVIFKMYLHVVG